MEYEYLLKAKFWGKYVQKNVWLFVHAIMMADCPITGGYPKIGAVASADLRLLAQCVPNKSRIRFRQITVEKAQSKYRTLMRGLDRILEADGRDSA
jgi:allophanate hydrolase subunit 2